MGGEEGKIYGWGFLGGWDGGDGDGERMGNLFIVRRDVFGEDK